MKKIKKRLIILAITVGFIITFLTISSSSVASAVSSEPAWNSTEEVYEISNVEEMQWMNNDLDNSYVLISDIDATNTQTWNGDNGFVPIGGEGDSFTGSFDGNGYVVKNLYINLPDNFDVGLFGYIDHGAIVENIGVENVDITGQSTVGGLVGQNGYDGKGTVSNCYSTGTVTGGTAGGLVGHNGIYEASVIENCYSSVNVDASGDDIAGGLVGKNGLYNDEIVVSNCYSTGDVTGDRSVGGLVGSNWGANIENCYSTGSVSGSLYRAGGLVGKNTNDVNTATGEVRIGRISNCYSTGNVTGDEDVGGLVGEQDNGIISNCYSASVNVSGSSNVGGFAGTYNDGVFENSFWDNEVCNQTQDFSGGNLENVYAKSTVDMKTRSTFTDAGWDFNNIWSIDDGQSYPYLVNNEQISHPGVVKIVGDGDFSDGGSDGVINPGASGTDSNPYIIENFVIEASNTHGIHIENTTTHFVIRNCVVENGKSNNNTAIYFDNVANGRIENTSTENSDYGFYIYSSDNLVLENNRAEKNDGYGFLFQYSSTILLKNNLSDNNNNHGFYFDTSDNNTLKNNRAVNNNGIGFELYPSDNNILENNRAVNNNGEGFDLYTSNNNVLENNLADYNSGIGFYLEGENQELRNNRSVNSGDDGFCFYDASNTVLENNLADNNTDEGFFFEISRNAPSAENFRLENNRALNNNNDGFSFYSSKNINLENNQAESNDDGFYFESSDNIEVENNLSQNNGWSGFYLVSSDNILLKNNLSENNSSEGYSWGFWFEGSENSTLKNNQAENEDQGFYLDSSDNNVLKNNLAQNNREYGFDIHESANNLLENNQAENNNEGFYLDMSYFDVADNNVLRNNLARNNTESGFSLEESINSRWENNRAEKNGEGFYIYGSTEPSSDIVIENNQIRNNDNAVKISNDIFNNINILHNNIENNTRYGIINKNSENTLNAPNNWWGDSSGPGGVGPGAGDNVSENVAYYPWIDYAAPTVSIDSPSDGGTVSSSDVTVQFSREDIGLGIDNYEFRVDSNSWENVKDNTITSHEFTGLSDSDHTLEVKAIDYSGNENTDGVTITVDTGDGGSGGGEINYSPFADFSYSPSSPTIEDTIDFADQSSDPDGSITVWSWDFGDGTTSNSENPSHTYDTADNYTVTLTVTDEDEASDTTSKTIEVSESSVNSPPSADAGGPYSVLEGESVELDGSGSSDSDGSIVNYSWMVVDDPTEEVSLSDSDTSTPVFTAPFVVENVEVSVSLTVTDVDNATDDDSVNVLIGVVSPPPSGEEVENMSSENAIKVIRDMISREGYSDVDEIFKSLSDDTLSKIWNGLSESKQDELQSYLSTDVKESLELGDEGGEGGFPWLMTIAGLIVLAIIVSMVWYWLEKK